jgi:hypothetical protein
MVVHALDITVFSSYSFRNGNFFSGNRYTENFEESWTLFTDPATGDLICGEVAAGPPLALWANSRREIVKRWIDCEGCEDLETPGNACSWVGEAGRMKLLRGTWCAC